MGRSGGSKLKVKGASNTRGKQEFEKIAASAKKEGLIRQSSLSELLANSYAAGLDCDIDHKIIDQINQELTKETSLDTTESLEKMLAIFQEQAMTKQQFSALQLKMKTGLLKTVKEKLNSEKSPEARDRLNKIQENVDQEVHQELIRTNSQYRRFF